MNPDNAGNQPRNKPVIKTGETAYFSKLPWNDLHQSLEKNKIPAVISNTAGTYLCNQIMYIGLHRTRNMRKVKACGFIHQPLLPEQVASRKLSFPSMSFDTLRTALQIILDTLVDKKR